LIEPVEARVGGQFGVEDQLRRRAAVLAGPELDEPEDCLRLLAFAQVRVGVAEDLALGILGQES
jgi:hypothetical protein